MAEQNRPASGESRSPSPSPAVLESIRTRSLQRLSGLLREMFDGFHTTLFDWTKDLPEAEQQRALEVTAGVRAKRAEMEATFSAHMSGVYAALLQPRITDCP